MSRSRSVRESCSPQSVGFSGEGKMRSTPLILAVDDTQENLDILRLRLESQGYEVSTATDGCEALERV